MMRVNSVIYEYVIEFCYLCGGKCTLAQVAAMTVWWVVAGMAVWWGVLCVCEGPE